MNYKYLFRTIVGIKCKDGILLGAEKLIVSKLWVDGTNRKIHNVDSHIGLVLTGKIPDGRNILSRARLEANEYAKNFAISMSGRVNKTKIKGMGRDKQAKYILNAK